MVSLEVTSKGIVTWNGYVYPPERRMSMTWNECEGLVAFTDENNRYFVCSSKHISEVKETHMRDVMLPVLFSKGEEDLPVNKYELFLIGKWL